MLSSNKLNYIEGVQKHAKRVATTTIVLSVIVLTILIVIHTIINHRKLADIIYNPFFLVIVLILSFFFFILYRGRQRALKLQKLIEQMSEEGFCSYYKYNLPYLFTTSTPLHLYFVVSNFICLHLSKSRISTLKRLKKYAGTMQGEEVFW